VCPAVILLHSISAAVIPLFINEFQS
jgi:hypothetical protein